MAPNLTPDEWNTRSTAAAARVNSHTAGRGWFPPCANGACVHAERTADGVVVTSTIPGNTGRVVFTHAEWDAFLPQVKDGAWDHTLSEALISA